MVVAANGLPNLWTAPRDAGRRLSRGRRRQHDQLLPRPRYRRHHAPHPRAGPSPPASSRRSARWSSASGSASSPFVFLTLTVNLLTACLAVSAILFYVFIYTLWLKRSTVENIVIGGAAGAVPPLCGWAAVTGHLDAAPLIMFAIIFLWTPPHFWALAISYTNDYADADVPMLPVTRGAPRRDAAASSTPSLRSLISLALYLTGDVGVIYLAIAAVFGAIFVWLAWRQVKIATIQAAMTLFKYSTTYLAIIFGAMVVDRLLPL